MTKQKLEAMLRKPIITEVVFAGDGTDFSAINESKKFLESKDFSVGSMQGDAPIGVARGDCYISKWRNLGTDISQLDGALVSDDFRNGSVVLYLTVHCGPMKVG